MTGASSAWTGALRRPGLATAWRQLCVSDRAGAGFECNARECRSHPRQGGPEGAGALITDDGVKSAIRRMARFSATSRLRPVNSSMRDTRFRIVCRCTPRARADVSQHPLCLRKICNDSISSGPLPCSSARRGCRSRSVAQQTASRTLSSAMIPSIDRGLIHLVRTRDQCALVAAMTASFLANPSWLKLAAGQAPILTVR